MADSFDISIGGVDAILLTYQANWQAGVRIQHRLPSRIRTGESGKERRSARSDSMRLTVAYDILTDESEAEELRNELGELAADDLLAVPLWVDAWPVAQYESKRRYEPQYVVNFDVGVGATVYAADSLPGSPTYGTYAPLVFGYLLSEPRFKALGVKQATGRIVLKESSPYSHRIDVKEASVDVNWPVELVPNWRSEVLEIAKNGHRRTLIGDLRELQSDGHERVNWWERGASFELDAEETGILLDFWHAKRGRVHSFEAPAWFAPGTATAAAPHGFASRFDSEVLDLDYTTPTLASARLRLLTLPWESGGSTAYEPTRKVRLFKFTYKSPTPVVFRYTDNEQDLTNTEATWTAKPFDLTGGGMRDLKLGNKGFAIESAQFVGNPLELFIPYKPDAPLWVEVYEAEIDDLDNGELIRYGRIDPRGVSMRSRMITAQCSFWGDMLENPFPKFRIQHRCNWRAYQTGRCGMVKASYKKTGTIDSVDGTELTVTTAATDATNTFAGGFLEIGDGLDYERRRILRSTKGTGTQALVVDRPLRINGASDAVEFYRGCDGRASTCRTLGHHDYFGGFEFIPEVNPATAQPDNVAGGKK